MYSLLAITAKFRAVQTLLVCVLVCTGVLKSAFSTRLAHCFCAQLLSAHWTDAVCLSCASVRDVPRRTRRTIDVASNSFKHIDRTLLAQVWKFWIGLIAWKTLAIVQRCVLVDEPCAVLPYGAGCARCSYQPVGVLVADAAAHAKIALALCRRTKQGRQ